MFPLRHRKGKVDCSASDARKNCLFRLILSAVAAGFGNTLPGHQVSAELWGAGAGGEQ